MSRVNAPVASSMPLVILASRSPRRAQLLREAGYRFVQADPPFDDPPQPDKSAHAADLVVRLASQKARSVLELDVAQAHPGAVVLAADTLVLAPDGAWLGQPADQDDARRMLELLIDAVHQVVTGVALIDTGGRRFESFADTARVALGRVDRPAVQHYLDSGDWRGKAGAYNLSDLERTWPFAVTGDPTTVVGLPMRKLEAALRGWAGRGGEGGA